MNLKKNIARLATAAMVVSSLGTMAPVNAASNEVSDTMDSIKVRTAAETTVNTFNAHIGAFDTADVVITFPSDFNVALVANATNAAGVSSDACFGAVSVLGQAVTVPATGCIADAKLVLGSIQSPTGAGSYVIGVASDFVNADVAVVLVTNDTVTVTATVDPSISFAINAQNTTCATLGSASTSVGLGVLNNSTRAMALSGVDSVNRICTWLSTNATAGAVVTVKNANGADGLKFTSVTTDVIPTSGASLVGSPNPLVAANTAKPYYGVFSFTDNMGTDSGVTPSSTSPVNVFTANYLAALAGTPAGVMSLSATVPITVWSVPGVTSNSYHAMGVLAHITATQPAHNDYSDALTFVATATF